MSMFTLAISCLPLPICLDSWTWHSKFLCNIALYSIRPCFYHQSHPQLGIVFALSPFLNSFWSYFSTDLQYHIGHLSTGEFLFQYPIILPFHTVHGVLKARILKWFAIPLSDHILSDLSTMTRPSWVAPRAWLSFIELDKAVVLVWLDWLVFCEYGFSVCALWCSLTTPTILLGFLLP